MIVVVGVKIAINDNVVNVYVMTMMMGRRTLREEFKPA
jgi:hypothetical protein